MKNLFQNGDFKDAMRDWSLQTVSTLDSNNWVTGTLSAGAAGFTQSSSTTAEALEGRSSGKWAKGAANYQRQGFQSEVLQVDKELQGNVVKFEFSYNLTQVSGTLSLTGVVTTHDIKIAVYDLTNSAWIQPSGHMAINSIGIAAIATGEFQLPINTAQVKMFIYQATTSTAAWSIVADSFSLGKVERVYGYAGTDWQQYTVSITGSTSNPTKGTTSLDRGWWRQVGDEIEVRFEYAQSAPGLSGSGRYQFSLPPGKNYDTAKINANNGAAYPTVGNGFVYDATGLGVFVIVQPDGTNTNALGLAFGASANRVGNGVSGDLSRSTVQLSFTARVPIVGISSSTTISSDADTRVTVAAASGAGTNAMATGTQYVLSLQSSNFDTHGAQTLGTATNGTTTKSGWYYTAKCPGYYQVTSQISTNSAVLAANSYASVSLRKNGSNNAEMGIVAGDGFSKYESINGTQVVFLNAGDYVELMFETSVTSVTLANNQGSSVNVFKLQGPSTIAASANINASARNSSAQAIANNTVVNLTGWTIDENTNGGLATDGQFTAQTPGIYLAIFQMAFNGASTGTRVARILKGGVDVSFVEYPGSNTSNFGTTATWSGRLLTGEILRPAVFQNSGGSLSVSGNDNYNKWIITKVGN